jgi:hypothetical protein
VSNEEVRSALYALAAVVSPLLLAYGIATEEQAAAIGSALVSIVGVFVAFYNRPTKG